MFEYDVALSFAGEQRPAVTLVADCLKNAGVKVFYDAYEKANLWGKDLYVHLSDVYQNKARYCVLFLSKEYAEKVWTNWERQSAQARALSEKGQEYILPVRFDSTNIPGILPTVGYLDFKNEGVSGICSALLEKLGRINPSTTSSAGETLKCSLSPRVLIRAADNGVIPEAQSCIWGDEIELSIQGDEDSAFLSQLRDKRPEVIVANGFDVAIAKPKTATRRTINGVVTWNVVLMPGRTDFNNFMEVGSGNTSAEQFAEMRARRILLDEYRYREDSGASTLQAVNDASREALIQGLGQHIKIARSHLPSLFRELRSNPRTFLEAAWITAVTDLKSSASVETIDRLDFTLTGTVLHVVFEGRRQRKYANVDPYEIRIDGSLELDANPSSNDDSIPAAETNAPESKVGSGPVFGFIKTVPDNIQKKLAKHIMRGPQQLLAWEITGADFSGTQFLIGRTTPGQEAEFYRTPDYKQANAQWHEWYKEWQKRPGGFGGASGTGLDGTLPW